MRVDFISVSPPSARDSWGLGPFPLFVGKGLVFLIHPLSGFAPMTSELPRTSRLYGQPHAKALAEKVVLPGYDYCFRGSSVRTAIVVLASLGSRGAMLSPAMSFLKSFPPPGSADGLRLQQPDTEAVLNGKGLGTGTLYIAESRLSWLDGSGLGFSLEYPTISLHAVSRDPNAYPQEHLYVMVNAKLGEESKEPLSDEDEEDNDDIEPISEFRFVPSDKSALEAMFTAMCECQALHPDPEDEDSDDYDGEEYDVEAHEQGQGDIPTFYTYEEGLSHLTAEGQATLERLEGMLSQSVSSQYNMAGVRTEDSVRNYEDGMEVETTPTVAGQFEDADVDH